MLQEHQGILSLPQDCFYRDLTPEEATNIRHFNFDHPSAYSFHEIISTLRCLKAGKPVNIPVYDFVTSARLPQVTPVAQADVILFDGILALYWPELRDLFDIKIFVEADADTRLSRRCATAAHHQVYRIDQHCISSHLNKVAFVNLCMCWLYAFVHCWLHWLCAASVGEQVRVTVSQNCALIMC